jgi:PAS domain S-box-containing protein
VLTPDGTVVQINRTPLEAAGLQQGDVVGKKFWECYWWTHSRALQLELEAACQRALRGEIVRFDAEIRLAEDRAMFIDCQIAPLRDEAGQITYLIPSAVDITRRREAEASLRASEEQFRKIYEHAATGITIASLEGLLEGCNPAYETITGYRESELRGLSLAGLVHPEDRASYSTLINQLLAGEVPHVQIENRYHRKDGVIVWVQTSFSTLRNGNGLPARIIGLARDITQRRTFQVELERLVAERTSKLQELVGDLEHFSYSITHDMRAPLRAMKGYGEVLVESCPECPNPQRKTFLKRIMAAADRMDCLIVDALNYSRAVRQELPLSPVDPGHLLRGMLDSYPEFQPDRADIQILGELPPVLANEAALTQCFSNLLGNAVKFVRPGERAQVRITSELVSDAVRIWIEDNGIGIPEPMIPKVFDMFSRGQTTHEGTGIGLALVRKVVHRMGGKVGVESAVGKGSRFWVELKAKGYGRASEHGLREQAGG